MNANHARQRNSKRSDLYSKGVVPHTMAVAAVAAGLSACSAQAANDVWVGNTNANFATLSNWTGSVTPNGNTPVFGTAGSAGTTLTNDISGATYVGFTFNSGASAYTIGGNSFTLTGDIANNGVNTQTINTAITMNTARTFSATSGQLVFGGNISGSSAGNWSLNSANKITLAGTNNVTTTTNGGMLINAGAGGVDITGSTTLTGSGSNSGYVLISGNVTTTIQSGGSLTSNGLSGGIDFIVGQNTNNTTSTLVVNGGTLTVGGNHNFYLGNNQDNQNSVLTISSGTATINRGSTTATDSRSFIAIGRDSANGTINLNGGTLATDRNFVRDASGALTANSSATFNFGGGTLKALANQSDWLNSATINTNQGALSSVTATNTSTIDANSFNVGINNAISGTGSFKINSSTSTGIVTFGGANTYIGSTTISAGTLALSSSGTIANSATIIVGDTSSSGTVLDLTAKSSFGFGTGQTVKGIGTINIGSGKTVTVNGALTPGNSVGTLSVTGNLTLASTATSTFEIASTGTGADEVSITGNFGLGGTVAFASITRSYSVGNTFDFLDGTLSGTFSNASTAAAIASLLTAASDPGAGKKWDASSFYSDGTASIVNAASISLVASGSASGTNVGSVNPTPAPGFGKYLPGFADVTNLESGNVTVTGFNPAGDSPVLLGLDLEGSTANIDALLSTLQSGAVAGGYTITDIRGDVPSWMNGTVGAQASNDWEFLLSFSSNPGSNSAFNFDFTGSSVTLDRIAVIPEPGALSILGIAGAVGLRSRRRNRK